MLPAAMSESAGTCSDDGSLVAGAGPVSATGLFSVSVSAGVDVVPESEALAASSAGSLEPESGAEAPESVLAEFVSAEYALSVSVVFESVLVESVLVESDELESLLSAEDESEEPESLLSAVDEAESAEPSAVESTVSESEESEDWASEEPASELSEELSDLEELSSEELSELEELSEWRSCRSCRGGAVGGGAGGAVRGAHRGRFSRRRPRRRRHDDDDEYEPAQCGCQDRDPEGAGEQPGTQRSSDARHLPTRVQQAGDSIADCLAVSTTRGIEMISKAPIEPGRDPPVGRTTTY